MNRYRKPVLALSLGVLFGTASAAWAMSAANLPPEHRQGSVTYMSGGVGRNHAAEMRKEAAKFPLGLEFTEGSRQPQAHEHEAYLANVPVTIKNAAGTMLLKTRSDGPYLLAKLPDGHYTVTAEHAGKTETRKLDVEAGKHRMVVFNWA